MGQLLDNITKAAQASKQPQGQVGGATEATFQDLRAAGGKQAAGTPSGQSGVAEQLGIAQQQEAQSQVTDQLQGQAQQAGVQEAQQQLQQEQFETQQKMQNRANDQQYQQQLDSMYNNLSQNHQQMDQQEKELAMEQLAFDQRLDNQQYVAGLEDRARRARLEEGNNFQEEMRKQVMGDQLALLEADFDNRMMEANKQDKYTLEQARSDAAFAMQTLNAALQDASKAQFAQGVGDLVSTGAGMGIQYAKDNNKLGFGSSSEGEP